MPGVGRWCGLYSQNATAVIVGLLTQVRGGGDENRKHSGFFFMSSMLLAQSARSEHAHQSALLGTRNGQRIHRFDLDPHPCVSAVVRSFRDVSFKVTNMEFAVTYSMEASKLQVQHLIWPD